MPGRVAGIPPPLATFRHGRTPLCPDAAGVERSLTHMVAGEVTGKEWGMHGPLIFIATNRLKPGRLDSERARVPGLVEFVKANEPRLLAFNEYVNEAGDEVSVVQVHPDAASMEAHIAIVAERARAAYAETLDATVRIQVFGQPSEEMLAALKQQAGEGVEIALHTEHLGGFTRVSSQD